MERQHVISTHVLVSPSHTVSINADKRYYVNLCVTGRQDV